MEFFESPPYCLDHDLRMSRESPLGRHMVERDQAYRIEVHPWGLNYEVLVANPVVHLSQIARGDAISILANAIKKRTSYYSGCFNPLLGPDHQFGFHAERMTPVISIGYHADFSDFETAKEEPGITFTSVQGVRYADYMENMPISQLTDCTPEINEKSNSQPPNQNDMESTLSGFSLLMKHLFYMNFRRNIGTTFLKFVNANTSLASNRKLNEVLMRDRMNSMFDAIAADRINPLQILHRYCDETPVAIFNQLLMLQVGRSLQEFMIGSRLPFVLTHGNKITVVNELGNNIPPVSRALMTSPLRDAGDLISCMNLTYHFVTKGTKPPLLSAEELEKIFDLSSDPTEILAEKIGILQDPLS